MKVIERWFEGLALLIEKFNFLLSERMMFSKYEIFSCYLTFMKPGGKFYGRCLSLERVPECFAGFSKPGYNNEPGIFFYEVSKAILFGGLGHPNFVDYFDSVFFFAK